MSIRLRSHYFVCFLKKLHFESNLTHNFSIFCRCLSNLVRTFLKDEYSEKTGETATQLVKFLLLCYDCLAVSRNEINQLFRIIFLTIVKAQSNVYQPVSSCWQAVEMLYGLLHELLGLGKKHATADDITVGIMSSLHDVLCSLTQTLVRTVGQEDERCSFYGCNAYFAMLNEVKSLLSTYKFVESLEQKFQKLLNTIADLTLSLYSSETDCVTVKGWLRFLVTLKLIIWIIDVTDATDFILTNERRGKLLKSLRSLTLSSNLGFPNEGKSSDRSYLQETNWRFVAEDIIATKWHCFNIVIKESDGKFISNNPSKTFDGSSPCDIVEACVEALSLTSGAACFPCLETLRLCLPHLIQAGDEITTILLLETAWKVLNEIRTRYSGFFWPALDIAVRIVFASELFDRQVNSSLVCYVRKFWESLLNTADDQTGLVSVAVSHLCKVFSNMYRSQTVNVVDYHADIIADICLFGPVHKKDQKLLLHTAAYVKCLDDVSGVIGIRKFKECECESSRVRVDLIMMLLNMDHNSQASSLLIFKLIRVLLERDQRLSESKASRFLNSENHRKKQRLWQIILILATRITDEKFASEVSDSVLKALERDNQPSVRFFIEWSLVRLLSSHVHLLETIWEEMKNLSKTRLSYVASLISILAHVFLCVDKPESQIQYLQRLIPAIVPCAFLNHSQIRAYIFAALQVISITCTENLWFQVCQQFPIVQSCLSFAQSVFEGEKEKKRLQKDRALFAFHPIEDFSIEVIFNTVPVITGVVDDEVINPSVFETEGSEAWVEVSGFPLYNRKTTQHEVPTAEITREKTETSCSVVCVTSDVQKKITHWNVTAPLNENHGSFDQLRQRPIDRRVSDLVVVASLIDRAPNLGGLCRTCEVFGASRLVLGSKHVISEKDFKSVSVSSEKWVDVEEVKIHELKTYLMRMKKKGFIIVGVEQTAQSKKLTDFHFPRFTVLVLGNEKAGIPVEIIHLLDECVEIPQYGIIRSLNVHVSGALLIWEYSRQHLNAE